MSKWKCDICNSEFNNYHAKGFNNKIYCPLCYYKHEFNRLQQEKEELIKWLEEVRNKPVALFPETQEQAEELGKVKFCIEVLEKLGE